MFSGRALTGTGGQYLQTFLNAIGATTSYLIIRTLPVDTLDLSVMKQKEIALNPDVSNAREKIIQSVLDKGNTQLLISVGDVSHVVVDALNPSLPVIKVPSFLSDNSSSLESALKKVKNLKLKLNNKAVDYFRTLSTIPRADLPAYTRFWMGTSGSRASRAHEIINGKKIYNGDYYIFEAPNWATKWSLGNLSSDEQESVNIFNQNFKP